MLESLLDCISNLNELKQILITSSFNFYITLYGFKILAKIGLLRTHNLFDREPPKVPNNTSPCFFFQILSLTFLMTALTVLMQGRSFGSSDQHWRENQIRKFYRIKNSLRISYLNNAWCKFVSYFVSLYDLSVGVAGDKARKTFSKGEW